MRITYPSVMGDYEIEVSDHWENLNIGDGTLEFNGVTFHLLFNGESGEGIEPNRKTIIVRSSAELLSEMDRLVANNNQTETRRHCSLHAADPDGTRFRSETDVEKEVEEKNVDIASLCVLTAKEKWAVESVYINGVKPADLARSLVPEGLSPVEYKKAFAAKKKSISVLLSKAVVKLRAHYSK